MTPGPLHLLSLLFLLSFFLNNLSVSVNLASATNTNGATVENLAHNSGYYRLTNTEDARMFYFFFASRTNRTTDPVVLWLSGGPGCSGSFALFMENGPFNVTNDLSLLWNDFGWDMVSNLIYVDQPTGTGFSYSSSSKDIRHNSIETAEDLYNFLQAFFGEHPQYVKNDFYIAGESYAGHYIPALGSLIHQRNKDEKGLQINLKGLAIGNGMVHPEIQYRANLDYALQMDLINKSNYEELSQSVEICEEDIRQCGTNNSSANCSLSDSHCSVILEEIIKSSPGVINHYDIRKQCESGPLCYNTANLVNFLNQNAVKQALGVGDINFFPCNDKVHGAMDGDQLRNYELFIPELLQDGIKLLIYAGEYDLSCNWLGNSRWVEAMKWSSQKDYLSAPTTTFTMNNVNVGSQKNYGPLTFLKVNNAGHLVPMDQPKASLEMFQRWIQDIPL